MAPADLWSALAHHSIGVGEGAQKEDPRFKNAKTWDWEVLRCRIFVRKLYQWLPVSSVSPIVPTHTYRGRLGCLRTGERAGQKKQKTKKRGSNGLKFKCVPTLYCTR